MNEILQQFLLDPNLKMVRGECLDPPVFGAFPIKSGQLHEWFWSWESDDARKQGSGGGSGGRSGGGNGRTWQAPLTVMATLAFRGEHTSPLVWIGRKCWPVFQMLHALAGEDAPRQLKDRCIFLDPPNDAERFWAIGQALRCPGVHAVIADASGMNATVSRRLQLAAESGMALGLLARPPWEINEPSYAATRWQVRPQEMQGRRVGWSIELISRRGRRAEQDDPPVWNAEWDYQVFRGTGSFDLSANVGRGTGATAPGRPGEEQALSPGDSSQARPQFHAAARSA